LPADAGPLTLQVGQAHTSAVRKQSRAFTRSELPASLAAVLLALVMAGPVSGCAARRAQVVETPAAALDQINVPGRPDPQPGDRVLTFDLNRNGRPNIYHHLRTLPDGSEQLIRKDIDLNGNGRVDVWRFYADGERLVREAFDLDFDGIVDVWNYYDDRGRLVRKEADLSLDGRIDLWKYYENGRLVRKERDTSGNGRPDYFEFWVDGEIDRIGEDLDGDGTVDRWTRRPRK
jgi:hypothetical protein